MGHRGIPGYRCMVSARGVLRAAVNHIGVRKGWGGLGRVFLDCLAVLWYTISRVMFGLTRNLFHKIEV